MELATHPSSKQVLNNLSSLVPLQAIQDAAINLKDVALHTPLIYSETLSSRYHCEVYLKREDLQVVRSYKLRGAYNKMSSISLEKRANGIVCSSAGNHAQGVAFACRILKIHGKIYMPTTTPSQKVGKVRQFGKEYVEVVLVGDTYDDAYTKAIEDAHKNDKVFVHPFDDPKVMAGQGTVGLEILSDIDKPIDFLFMPVGGGGLTAGTGSTFKHLSPTTQIIGVEPQGAPAMYESILHNKVVTLETIEKFVDGAAVKSVGQKTFDICKQVLDNVTLVPEGKVCTTILELYNEDAIVAEPAGALSIACLDFYQSQIKGKTVVCVLSGGNNDITRTEEIKERSLLYEGLKHYFIIRFPQRAGALRDFLNNALGPDDDIVFFEYTKKTSRDKGPALVGIELSKKENYEALLVRMKAEGIKYETINDKPLLFEILV